MGLLFNSQIKKIWSLPKILSQLKKETKMVTAVKSSKCGESIFAKRQVTLASSIMSQRQSTMSLLRDTSWASIRKRNGSISNKFARKKWTMLIIRSISQNGKKCLKRRIISKWIRLINLSLKGISKETERMRIGRGGILRLKGQTNRLKMRKWK